MLNLSYMSELANFGYKRKYAFIFADRFQM